jgi:hypothetical protein
VQEANSMPFKWALNRGIEVTKDGHLYLSLMADGGIFEFEVLATTDKNWPIVQYLTIWLSIDKREPAADRQIFEAAIRAKEAQGYQV